VPQSVIGVSTNACNGVEVMAREWNRNHGMARDL